LLCFGLHNDIYSEFHRFIALFEKRICMRVQSTIADTLLGKSIGGYQIVKRVGQSNLSTVYLAQSQKLGQAVIFTTFTLPDTFSLQARMRFNERFMRVASALVRLRHPHIAPIYDFGMQPDYLYMITALTPADTLAELVHRQPHLSITQVLHILRQVAGGMDYAHRSEVIHGSLSSDNILLGNGQQVQIAGFGLVQLLALSGIESSQHPYAHVLSVVMSFLGNPFSIAPEVVQGEPVHPAADVYALGILLFEMLGGHLPFVEADPLKTALAHVSSQVPSIRELRPDIPLSFDRVLQKAMAYDPAQRYASAGKLVQALEQALWEGDTAKLAVVKTEQNVVQPPISERNPSDSTPGRGGQSSMSHPGVNKKRRHLVATLAIGGVVLGGLGTGGVILAHIAHDSSDAQGHVRQASANGRSQPTSLHQSTKTVSPSPTATSKPSPTPTPSPTPSQTSTIVGSTDQAVNSSTSFVNPLDGNGSLLINLPNGKFVAFESICTHEGVRVYYDTGSQKLVCPRHNALFDPAQGATVLQGPPQRPLPAVPIHINGDGTITVG
jgi:serine/threonine protein kinase